MKTIKTKRGILIRVSDEDLDLVSKMTWVAMGKGRTKYAIHARNGKSVLMHRLIMSPAPGQVVDHIDHDGLNNQRENLRVCSPAENARGKRRKRWKKFKGVHKSGARWQAMIRLDGKLKALGSFLNPVEAARAYDVAARKHFGQFAELNFTDADLGSHKNHYQTQSVNLSVTIKENN